MARNRRDWVQLRRRYTPWKMQDKSSGARWMSKRDLEVAKPKYPLERRASADTKWAQAPLKELSAGH